MYSLAFVMHALAGGSEAVQKWRLLLRVSVMTTSYTHKQLSYQCVCSQHCSPADSSRAIRISADLQQMCRTGTLNPDLLYCGALDTHLSCRGRWTPTCHAEGAEHCRNPELLGGFGLEGSGLETHP